MTRLLPLVAENNVTTRTRIAGLPAAPYTIAPTEPCGVFVAMGDGRGWQAGLGTSRAETRDMFRPWCVVMLGVARAGRLRFGASVPGVGRGPCLRSSRA